MSGHVGELRLPVVGVDASHGRFTERVVAERIGPARFRILRSPGAIECLAEGDVIELAETERGFRVVERSGNLCIWVYASVGSLAEERTFDTALRADLAEWGGRFWVASRFHWALTIHVSVGFERILSTCDGLVLRGAARCWFYANVYESHTGGAPLNWWNDPRFYPQPSALA